MPLSLPFRPNNSPSPPSGPLPTLPFEIVRRIIYHRLSIPPSYPFHLEDRYEPSWDAWSGVKGRMEATKRLEERKDVTRTARGLMGVCKAWKPVVMKYLYSSPYLTDNLSCLTSCVLVGDSKWSDINIHQFSIPGRYITLLDLSTISNNIHPTEILKSIRSIFPILPNLQHLRLPPYQEGELPFSLDEISQSPFRKSLKCLEGVHVDMDMMSNGQDGLIDLLRHLPNLEVLHVHGGTIPDSEQILSNEGPYPPLRLDQLHSIKLEDVKSGDLLSTLLESELPSLNRLSVTNYYNQSGDATYKFQEIHGYKIRSLTYLQGKSWPWFLPSEISSTTPCEKILELHPNLIHLSFLLPDYNQLDRFLSTLRESPNHPLQVLTIFKWVEPPPIVPSTPSPIPSITTSGKDTNKLLREIADNPPKNLKRINIDGFRWVKIELGKIAMNAGTSGEMRLLAGLLQKRGIELGDMDGNLAPSPSINTTSSGSGERAYGPMTGGRRRSSGGMTMVRMNIGMSGNAAKESGREDEDGG
ncbi:uncharacterized protein IL334_005297 [Kwoniella shivajii]|uniref:F-box domain-containing protein n=1 Tax=Kwoniella shivajii TaxID=564305 RepID=A0ABZ1D2R3_9TREE|nr:hypothetical protein IL334_005297 [Kwoniella shivajii]